VIKSRRMRSAGNVALMDVKRVFIRYWCGNRSEREHWEVLWPRWVDNIRMDLQEVGCGYVDWIGLAKNWNIWRTLVSVAMNLLFP